MIDPRLHALDDVLRVDVAIDLGLVVAGEADDGELLAVHGLRFRGRIPRRRGAQKSLRQHPDLELLRPRRVGGDHDRLNLRLLADDRLLAAAARRVLTLHANAIHA